MIFRCCSFRLLSRLCFSNSIVYRIFQESYIIQLLTVTDSCSPHLILPQYQSSYTPMDELSKLDLSAEKKQDQRIVTLQREVENYRIKIANYEQLQKEINLINESINQPRQVSGSKNKDLSGRKIPEIQSKGGPAVRISSNKKIKVYQLQKKLKKLLSDLQEKQIALQRAKVKEADLLSSIETMGRRIEEEKKNTETLIHLQSKIQKEIDSTCQKIQSQLTNLEDSVKSKELFNFEKIKLRDQLKRLRAQLPQICSSDKREPIELSLSLSEEIQNLHDSLKGADEGLIISLSESERGWQDRQKYRIESLMFKIDVHREKNAQILSSFYKQKKQFNQNQVQAKHHKTTIQIHSTRLKKYTALIAKSKANIAHMNEQSEVLSAKMRRCQGVRGDLRGKIGVSIEQHRLVRNVNVLLEEDLERLQQKCSYMKMLKRRFERQIR